MTDSSATHRLFSKDVLEVNNEEISLSSLFEKQIEAYMSTRRTRDETRQALEGLVDDAVLEPLVDLGHADPRTIAELRALSEFLQSSSADLVRLLPVLRLFRSDSVRTEGVPDPFVPIPGDHLPPFSRIYSRLMVYVWLDDCDPCDAMKRRLESVLDDAPGVMTFAVYGPDHTDLLADEYDVTGGPVLLYMLDGNVDLRLHGAHDENVIETELEALRDRSMDAP